MPVPATREEFLDLVRKANILDEERLTAFGHSAERAGVPMDQPRVVAQRMIQEGLITKFQAEQLLRGKFERFLLSGKYRLLEPIGSGGMGMVYLCFHIYMHRLVAVKILPFDKLKDEEMKARFYREARLAAALDHPNIVRAYDIDWDQGGPGQKELHFIVMEFIDGVSLQDLVSRRGPIAPERAAHYVTQSAQGLQHAHEAGLVHRDIKPGNLLLDRSGTVKVLDLGLARLEKGGEDNLTERYDEKNAVLGTADYLAPEQARGEAVDIRADIYSLGATLYFLLGKKSPFEEGTVAQKLLWAQTKPPKPIREMRSDVPEELARVLDRMMAKDPKDRYQTPKDVVEALAPWTATPIPPPSAEEMPRRSLAASAPSSQVLMPSTPSPRSVPTDLVGNRPPSGPPSAKAGPRTPAKIAPRTPTPNNGVGDRTLAPIIRGPAPKSGVRGSAPKSAVRSAPKSTVRRRPPPKSEGMSAGMIFAAAAGGAGLLFVGIFIAWLLKKPAHHGEPSTTVPMVKAPAAVEPKSSPAPSTPIKPEDAAKYYDQKATVEMRIMHVGKASKTERYFLNSKSDYNASDNFTVTFTKSVLDQLAARGISNHEALANKTVRVTGTIIKYNGKPEIDVTSADQIQIVGS
jgi:serine/threonine protein kinase